MIEAAVVDASVAIKWVVGETGAEEARRLAGAQLSAPDILLVECANALWAKFRRGEIEEDDAHDALAALRRAPVGLTPGPVLVTDALRIGLLISHPIYDCLYLALSLQTRCPVVTADRRLAAAVVRHDALARSVILLDQLS